MTSSLPERARLLLRSVADVVCPRTVERDLSAEVVAHFELSYATLPGHIRAALLAGLAGYDLAALAWPGVAPRRASRLSPEDAERYFAGWWNSPLALQREFAKAVKGFLCLAYYEHPDVLAAIGYTPQDWIDKVKKVRLDLHSAAVEAHERALLAPDPLPPMFDRATETAVAG